MFDDGRWTYTVGPSAAVAIDVVGVLALASASNVTLETESMDTERSRISIGVEAVVALASSSSINRDLVLIEPLKYQNQ